MNHVERFRAVVNGKPVDRMPMVEWAVWWDLTIERWRGEGLPEFDTSLHPAGVSNVANYCPDRYSICDHFGLDPYFQY